MFEMLATYYDLPGYFVALCMGWFAGCMLTDWAYRTDWAEEAQDV